MDESLSNFVCFLKCGDGIGFGNNVVSGCVVLDVVDIIEDLLEQISKVSIS